MSIGKIFNGVLTVVVCSAFIGAGIWIHHWIEQGRILRLVVERLSADSRAAEVLVTKSEYDETTEKIRTTIKFLEFDADGKALEPRYFSFQGNVIQFQSLVIRFDDHHVHTGDRLKGKSAYLFLKAFVLDGENTQEFDITEHHQVPRGYQIEKTLSEYEKELWQGFWDYALNPEGQDKMGIKNAQIEAPGSMFLPGTIYTLKIEHDGGLRIDAQPIPEILKGEQIQE